MSHRTVPDELLLLEVEDPPDEPLLLELEDEPPPLDVELVVPLEVEVVVPLDVDVVVPLDVELVVPPEVEVVVPPDVVPLLDVEEVVPLESVAPPDVLVVPPEVDDPEDEPLDVVPLDEEPEVELPYVTSVDRSVAAVSNVFSSDFPSSVRPTIRTTATTDAIRVYSIEVVPPSEIRNLFHDM